jgi:hypothetical protein
VPVNVIVANTIIHGSQNRETGFPSNPRPGFDVEFSYCLLPLADRDTREIFQNCIFDTIPGFLDAAGFNYRLAETSSAIDAGDPAIGRLFQLIMKEKADWSIKHLISGLLKNTLNKV